MVAIQLQTQNVIQKIAFQNADPNSENAAQFCEMLNQLNECQNANHADFEEISKAYREGKLI